MHSFYKIIPTHTTSIQQINSLTI